MKALVAVLAVAVVVLGWTWVDARSEVNDLRVQVGRNEVATEALQKQADDLERELVEADEKASIKVEACQALVANYAEAEAEWQRIIQGLGLEGETSAWAEDEWNAVIQTFIFRNGEDLRAISGDPCGLTQRNDGTWVEQR